jgi:WD40 repeat protein
MNSDFRDLLKLFNAHRVRYLVVGGYAVMKYTEPRYTKDLDIWVEASPKNARAVFRALRRFEAPLANLTEADFAKEGFFYQVAAANGTSSREAPFVAVLDVDTGRVLLRREIPDERFLALGFSGDGRRLAVAGTDRTVLIWDLAQGLLLDADFPADPFAR